MAQLLKVSVIIIISVLTASNFQIGVTINANDFPRNPFIFRDLQDYILKVRNKWKNTFTFSVGLLLRVNYSKQVKGVM